MKIYLINKLLFSSYLFSIILWNFSLFSQSILPTFHGSHVNTAVSNQLPPEDPNVLQCANFIGSPSPYSSPDCSYTDGCSNPSSALSNGSTIFNYTGGVQDFTVGGGVTSIKIQVWGAQGDNDQAGFNNQGTGGGKGGYAEGILSVTPGQVLKVYVGENPNCAGYCSNGSAGGWNGGGMGNKYGAPGGGASDVRVGGTTLNDRVIVAGGGGGNAMGSYGNTGGDGGGLIGCNGKDHCYSRNNGYYAGHGGSQNAGGAKGFSYGNTPNGSFGQGGGGNSYHNAGGGGGWYGGGSGAAHAGAGGGSSYIGGVSGGCTISGLKTGHGQIIISW